MESEFVIIRTYSAGVHCGNLRSRKGKEVILENARRIWRWYGAKTLNEIANHGVDQEKSKISEPVKEITLIEAIEVIPCTNKAEDNLKGCLWN